MNRDQILKAADQLVAKRDYDTALKEYQKLLDADPKDRHALQRMGELYQWKKKDHAQAAHYLARAAESCASEGFFLKAVALYKQVHKLNPDLLVVNLRLAELHQQLGLISEAAAYFQVVADHYEKAGDTRSLIGTLERIVGLDRKSVTSKIKLAELYAREKRTGEAGREFRSAAEYLQRNNRTDDALRVLERLSTLEPDNLALTKELAQLYLSKAEWKRSLAKLQVAFKADGRDVETLNLLAQAFQGLGQTSKTVSVYKELARVYQDMGRVREADDVWGKIAAMDPADPELLARSFPAAELGPREGLTGELPAAVPAPMDKLTRGQLSNQVADVDAYVRHGLYDKALERLRMVFAVDPENLDAHEKAYGIYVASGKTAQADEQLLNVLRLFTRRMELKRAQPYLDILLKQTPHHPELPAFLAVLRPQGLGRAPTAQEQHPAPRLPLTVLHLTDLHFAEPSERFPSAHYWNTPEWPGHEEPEYNQRGLLKSLLRDLKENQWTPELVIVSGDLLDRGQASGVRLAVDFLKQLSAQLKLPPERFVLVPGNHDEVRDARTADERYLHFSRIWTGFYGVGLPWIYGRSAHQQVELFDLREQLGVQLIGFNSCEGHDRGLWTGGAIGTAQLERAEELLEKSGKAPFRIAVMHHHLYNPTGTRKDLSVMEGAAEVRAWLKKHRFQLAVHGHQHVDWHEEDSAGDWILSVVAGGSAGVGQYGRQQWELRIGYQVIRLESETSGYRCRRWYEPMKRSFVAASESPRENLRFGAWQVQPAGTSGPTPRYQDEETRLLSFRLEAAQTRRTRLQEQGASTKDITREILELRRQLREGGQLRAGDYLGEGRFLLLETVGRGGFATVWRAHDLTRKTEVAIKVLHTNLAGDPLKRDRFFRGARRMAELRHPAVARVLEQQGEDGGYHYFVMEFVGGGDLRQAVLKGAIGPERAIPIILRVGEALAVAHGKGSIHRDVKPANILLSTEGAPLLTDFDLVGGGDTTGGTATGGAMGTFLYAAPECMREPQKATASADVYSLGMTAIFALYGEDLPADIFRNPQAVLDRLSCPRPVLDVLLRAIEWEAPRRYRDAGAFVKALREATSGPPG
jgi:tetratricopeptide (TPR) repeat protein